MPDFYPAFVCKCGACRNACCHGWDVAVDFAEYNKMLGLNCKKSLRSRLDRAFYIAERPSFERYALINHSRDGKCPLIGDDGLCMLQKECGEENIPTVCRMYPRSIDICTLPEITTSGSCEKTVELLMRREKVEFIKRSAEVSEGEMKDAARWAESEVEKQMRVETIVAMQKRELPLLARIDRVGEILAFHTGADLPKQGSHGENVVNFIRSMHKLIKTFDSVSDNMLVFGDSALESLGICKDEPSAEELSHAAELFAKKEKRLKKALPDVECYYENILVNHMFYERYPLAERYCESIGAVITPQKRAKRAFLAFCAACGLVAFITVCNATEQPAECVQAVKDSFADSAAAALRFIEHTSFYSNAASVLADC